MVEEQEAADFLALTKKISTERGFGCASYKEKCLRRRIAVRMRARGVHRYEDYAAILDTDAAEYDRLLDALTINVTKLFRNWDAYAAMAEQVVPALWNREGRIRVWSAGCSSGEEPYSLAVLFYDYASRHDRLREISRVTVLGSDIDRQSLDRAARGEFDEADFADTPPELRRRYFSPEPPFRIDPAVRAMVRFERRDLLSEPAPPGPHDMIVCRNVLIYFDRDTQERLFDSFYEALAPEGFLVLGKVETLLGRARSRFAPVDARERVFRRL
ncbi:MAG TPA: protein-glutamate O-methyltransferase CheR [Gemmatimonadaceae bacterium]|nr:protein-glutamate O-methyltransferase CheR [Gemmatimonadaceae bacterium]